MNYDFSLAYHLGSPLLVATFGNSLANLKIILYIESHSKETIANSCPIVERRPVKVNIIIDLLIWEPLLAMQTIDRILLNYELQLFPKDRLEHLSNTSFAFL